MRRPAWSTWSPAPTSTWTGRAVHGRRRERHGTRPWLATDKVRFVGEPVVAVLTEQPYQGQDAADLVEIDYDPLPAVVGLRAAASDEVLLFPDVGTNTADGFGLDKEFDEHLFDDCEVVVTQEIVNQRLAAAALETRAAAAVWASRTGRAASPSGARRRTRRTRATRSRSWLGDRRPRRCTVIAPDVGGGFGAKIGADPEFALVAWLARRTGRPVRWTETRSENMTGMLQGRAQLQTITIGGNRDGDVQAYRLDVLADAGRLPADRRGAAELHPDDGPRRLRHPEGRVAGQGRRHHHDVDRRLPRRGQAGGHRRHRAGDGPVRGRDRQGPRRGPQAQRDRARTRSPSRTKGGATYDSGEYAKAHRPRARRRGTTPSCVPSRPPGASAATPCSSGSGSRCSWRSPAAARSPRTPRSRCTPTARSPCSPAPRRTARATPRRGRCWPASTSASRSRRSP